MRLSFITSPSAASTATAACKESCVALRNHRQLQQQQLQQQQQQLQQQQHKSRP